MKMYIAQITVVSLFYFFIITAYSFVPVWNLVSHPKRRTWIEGVSVLRTFGPKRQSNKMEKIT